MTLPNEESRIPPGPDGPVALGIDPETLSTLLELRRNYGNMVSIVKPNGRQAWFINDAAEVRKMLTRRHHRYEKGPGFERVKMLLGNGLIVSDGDVWRRSRRMIQPAFTRHNVHRLISLMVTCSEARAIAWEAVARDGGTLDITQEMSDFALELILRCIFGPDYETHIVSSGENPFAFLSKDSERNLRIVMQVRQTRDLIMAVIKERRARDKQEVFDFLSMYMSATDKSGAHYTDEELLDELVTLIVAGWFLLAQHKEAESELLAEVSRLIPDGQGIDQETLTEMTWCQQLLEETLRLYPPVWLFTRRAIEEDDLTDYDVGADTDIFLSPYILHRTEIYWPDPERFDPSRFGPGSPYKKGERPYFPFSLGPRRCLGEYFSFLEMKVHLGLLIQKFRMTLVSDSEPTLDLGINLRTQSSILLRPELYN